MLSKSRPVKQNESHGESVIGRSEELKYLSNSDLEKKPMAIKAAMITLFIDYYCFIKLVLFTKYSNFQLCQNICINPKFVNLNSSITMMIYYVSNVI